MSDFLDRLAARAIGGEAALAPRLPSLFEPLSRTPSMAMADEGEAPARVRAASRVSLAASVAAPPARPPPPAHELAEPRVAHIPLAEHAPPRPKRAATDAPRASMPPSRAATPVRAMAAEPSRAPSVPDRAAVTSSPVSPRASRIASGRQESARPPATTGALLPAAAPVFATIRGAPAPTQPASAAAMRHRRDAQADHRNRASSEPVVHVSIGRLEVRAAPAAVAPPRRREEPRPSSLDDYLRQRGKATP